MAERIARIVKNTRGYAAPRVGAPRVFDLSKGQSLKVVGKSGEFYHVEYGRATGGSLYTVYVHQADIASIEESAMSEDEARSLSSDRMDFDSPADATVSSTSPRYAALRTISEVFTVLGWLVLVGGTLASLIAGIALMGSASGDDAAISVAFGFSVILGGIIGSLVYGLVLLAFGEVVSLLISLEENARAATADLARLVEAQ